jgi:HAD superfamily hydrolase (TIGR01509 family)
MRPVDTITFDLWNTLLAHDALYDADIRRIRAADILDALRNEGLDVTMQDVERGYSLSDGRLLERWSGHLDFSLDEQLAVFIECMGLEPTTRLVEAIDVPYADAVLKMRPVIIDGAREAVEEIKNSGYRVALISNTGRTPGRAMRRLLIEYGLYDLFETATFSNEEGIMKPRPEIFHRTLARLGSDPERTVHVGDHGLLDVLGARRAGIRCVQVTQYAPDGHGEHVPDVSIERISGLAGAIEAMQR